MTHSGLHHLKLRTSKDLIWIPIGQKTNSLLSESHISVMHTQQLSVYSITCFIFHLNFILFFWAKPLGKYISLTIYDNAAPCIPSHYKSLVFLKWKMDLRFLVLFLPHTPIQWNSVWVASSKFNFLWLLHEAWVTLKQMISLSKFILGGCEVRVPWLSFFLPFLFLFSTIIWHFQRS